MVTCFFGGEFLLRQQNIGRLYFLHQSIQSHQRFNRPIFGIIYKITDKCIPDIIWLVFSYSHWNVFSKFRMHELFETFLYGAQKSSIWTGKFLSELLLWKICQFIQKLNSEILMSKRWLIKNLENGQSNVHFSWFSKDDFQPMFQQTFIDKFNSSRAVLLWLKLRFRQQDAYEMIERQEERVLCHAFIFLFCDPVRIRTLFFFSLPSIFAGSLVIVFNANGWLLEGKRRPMDIFLPSKINKGRYSTYWKSFQASSNF